jgi:hypothetical protein
VHDQTTEHDDYLWPTCAAGPTTGPRSHPLWQSELDRLVCWPCEQKTAARITELPALFQQLNQTAMLMKGASRTGGGSFGTRTAPIPPRLEVLNLVGPGGLSTKLQAIEDSWRQALGWAIPPTTDRRTTFPIQRAADGRTLLGQPHRDERVYPNWRTPRPGVTVPRHVTFLAGNLRWACERYESIGQDIDTLRRLHGECIAIANNEPRPGRIQTGTCPAPADDGPCGTPLTASTTSHRIHCTTCGTSWDGMGEWRNLRTAQETIALEMAGTAA